MSRIAYGIMCHHSVEYVQEQYRLLYSREARFYYHADIKAPPKLVELLNQLAAQNQNVVVLSSQFCSWAGFSLTAVMIRMIETALNCSDWDHLVFLSEQHLPLQNYAHIAKALEPNHNYLEKYVYNSFPEAGKKDIHNRSAYLYRELPGVGGFATRPSEPGEDFYEGLRHGSQWVTLCRLTCEALVQPEGQKHRNIFQHCVLSDENAIQTWVSSLPEGPAKIVNRNNTYVADPSRGGRNDMTFDEDLFFLAREKGYLFIRKRSLTIHPRLVEYFATIIPESQRPGRIALHDLPVAFNELLAAETMISCMNRKAAERGFTLAAAHPTSRIPNLFVKVKDPRLNSPFNVFLVSQDLFNFKVLSIMSEPFRGFISKTVGGYRSSVVRARLFDISFNREIHLADDHDFGFYQMKNISDLDQLLALIELHIERTAAITQA